MPTQNATIQYNHIMFPKKAYTSENTHGPHQNGSAEVHKVGRRNKIQGNREK